MTRQVTIPSEVAEKCDQLIVSFKSAIRYLEEVQAGDIDETGNIYYLLHDWSMEHEEYNDELQSWWDVLGDFYEEQFKTKGGE
jgi:hypothetical protein